MNILITGGSGFIGHHLTERLLKDGHFIVNLDVESYKHQSNPQLINIECDITNSEIQDLAIGNIDIIIHLAAIASPPVAEKQPNRAFDINVLGTYQLLRLATKLKVQKFILSSTAHVYGTSPKYIPTPESHPYFLQDNYTTTKLIDENLCRLFWNTYNLPYITLRLFNTYGYGQPKGYFIPDMLYKSLTGHINLQGENITKDFIYIDDVIEAFVKSIDSDFVGELNVGTGFESSLYSIVKVICEETNSTLTSATTPKESRMCADISRIRKVLNWEPQYTIDRGLYLTIKRFMQEHESS